MPTATNDNARRSNRILLTLAAAWMAVSIAVGGAVGPQSPSQSAARDHVTSQTGP